MLDGRTILARSRVVRSAARNAWAVSWLGPGVERPRPHPSEVVHDAPHAQLRRFTSSTPTTGRPVLLVPPLAVPATCWDLRPGQSLAAYLAEGDGQQDRAARPTYVVDYGDITFADRQLGFEDFACRIVPDAVRRVSALHDGAPVHLVGWSLGGTISLLAGAAQPELPIASITALGAPIDYGLNASARPLRWLDERLGSRVMTAPTALLGGVPAPLVQLVYRGLAPTRELKKPWFLLTNLADTETLARSEAIDQFMAAMPGYPGRLYHQMHTRLIVRRELATGTVHLGRGVIVELDRLVAPVTLVGSTTDAVASAAAVEAGTRSFPSAATMRYVEVTGFSHLGLVAGSAASEHTWPAVVAQLEAADA